MSNQTFEILCPTCRSVVPADAPGCPNCAAKAQATRTVEVVERERPVPTAPDLDIGGMAIKDYHRFVRSAHSQAAGVGAGGVMTTYLPFVLLLVGLLVGAAVVFGKF